MDRRDSQSDMATPPPGHIPLATPAPRAPETWAQPWAPPSAPFDAAPVWRGARYNPSQHGDAPLADHKPDALTATPYPYHPNPDNLTRTPEPDRASPNPST